MSKWGLPKWGNPYGNRASVVVRARESFVHGEGKQPLSFNVNFGKCERHEKKSRKDIKQSDATQFRLGVQVRTFVSDTV